MQNLNRDYTAAIRRLHDLGVMVNGSFVFGMDEDDETVFGAHGGLGGRRRASRPPPSTSSRPIPARRCTTRMAAAGRILHDDWDLYDTRHVVFQPARLSPAALEAGYWRAYRDFYSLVEHCPAARGRSRRLAGELRHVAYAVGWKKLEPLWDWVIRARRVGGMRPVLESVLNGLRPGARVDEDPQAAARPAPFLESS